MVTKRGFWTAIQGQAKVVRPPDRRFSVESNYPNYNLFIIIIHDDEASMKVKLDRANLCFITRGSMALSIPTKHIKVKYIKALEYSKLICMYPYSFRLIYNM